MRTKRVRRTTEITMETAEYIFARKTAQPEVEWCVQCGAQVSFLKPEEAAREAGVTARSIYRWVEEERIHFVETESSGILVCRASLSNLRSPKFPDKVIGSDPET